MLDWGAIDGIEWSLFLLPQTLKMSNTCVYL